MAILGGLASAAGAGNLGTLFVTFAADSDSLLNAFAGAERAVLGSSASMASGVIKMATVITTTIVAMAAVATREFAKFEQSFANVQRTIRTTEADYNKLANSFRQMAKEIPVNVNEINAVASAAGQLGIKRENIEKFTRTMLDLSRATKDLSSDQAASSLARFANVTNMSQKDFDRLGSTVTALDYSLATSAGELVAMATRIAGGATQIGMTEPQIMGFAAALSSVGIQAELGGTAMNQLMIRLSEAVQTGGDRLNEFAKVAGMTGDQFTATFAKSGATAIIKFIQGLQTMRKAGGDVFGTLDLLGVDGIRLTDVLNRAAGASGLFNDALQTGVDAWDKNNATTKATEKIYGTFASQAQITMNMLRDLAITLGEALAPHLGVINKMIQEAVKNFGGWAQVSQTFATNFVPAIITGVGFIADAFETLQAVWNMLKLSYFTVMEALVLGLKGLTTAIKFVVQGLLDTVTFSFNAAIAVWNKVPWHDKIDKMPQITIDDDVTATVDKWIKEYRKGSEEAATVLMDIANNPTYSERLSSAYEKMQGGIAKSNKKLVDDVKTMVELVNKEMLKLSDIERNRAQKKITDLNVYGHETTVDKEGNKIDKFTGKGMAGLDSNTMLAMQTRADIKEAKTELEELKKWHEMKLDLTKDSEAKLLQLIKGDNTKLFALQMERAHVALSSASSTFDSLSQIAETWGGKQSGFYQAMFVASKAFAIADATVKIAQGIANAAYLPYPENLVAMASVAAATASIVSAISAVTLNLSGKEGKAMGGPVSAGTAYIVGEKGPELFMPSQSGSIVSNDKLNGMGGSTRVIVNNYSEMQPEIKEHKGANGEKVIEILMRKVKDQIGSEIRDGRGTVSRAIESTYNVGRGKR